MLLFSLIILVSVINLYKFLCQNLAFLLFQKGKDAAMLYVKTFYKNNESVDYEFDYLIPHTTSDFLY